MRIVICMDSSPGNIAHMKKELGELPNLRIEERKMSDGVGVINPRDQSFNMGLDEEFLVVHTGFNVPRQDRETGICTLGCGRV